MKINDGYKEKGLEVGKIAPCPFCGTHEHLNITNQEPYEKLVAEHGSSVITLRCKGCDMELSQYDIPNNNYMMGVGKLVERWNHRA